MGGMGGSMRERERELNHSLDQITYKASERVSTYAVYYE